MNGRTEHETDHVLAFAIEDELSCTPNVHVGRVGVSVDDGAVTLYGEVNSYPERDDAVRAALRVRGVTAVADEITVEHRAWGPRTDADIARDVAAVLERGVVTPADSVKAAVHDRVVTLTGAVASHDLRGTAQRTVDAVSGVMGIVNQIQLKQKVTVEADKTG